MAMSEPDITLTPELVEWVISLRRWFHRHPEPSGEEHATQAKVIETLDELGIENRAAARTGVIATIFGGKPGKTIALRADMDALRIAEPETRLNPDYRSQNDGMMHACGHDGHMAMVLGAARRLQEHRDRFSGSVRLLFQPCEEAPPGGATAVIRDGGLDGVDAVVGIHLFGDTDSGVIRYRSGPFMASPYIFRLRVTGRSGHHLHPDRCIDPIAIAARFVAQVPDEVRSKLSADDRYVLGFGTFNGGTQFNQTPDEAVVTGSFRAFSRRVADTIERTMRDRLDALVKEFASPDIPDLPRYELEIPPGYPVLVNDPAFTARATVVLKQRFPMVVDETDRNFGAEDFAEYLVRVPGMFLFLGARNPDKGIDAVNHSSRFDIDEDVLAIGVNVFVSLAVDYLENSEQYRG